MEALCEVEQTCLVIYGQNCWWMSMPILLADGIARTRLLATHGA